MGADEGVVIIAREQSSGRGRQGRTWVSGHDAGLYFSIVLRPRFPIDRFPLITLMAGVVVHQTLTELGVACDIKWVNDILAAERKICGILAETTDTPTGKAIILGIGINIRSSNFPPELSEIVTSIERETGQIFTIDDVAEPLTERISELYELLDLDDGADQIINEWSKRSTYFRGKSVTAKVGDRMIDGVTDGLEPNGALRLITFDGETEIIQAGDVMKLRSTVTQ